MTTRTYIRGFTIIELTLAMTFVSILLVSVAMLSIQLMNQYTRGSTLKEVNQAGTEVVNDIKRTMGQAQLQDNGVRTKQITSGGVTLGVALCIGNYSYIASDPIALEADKGIKVGPTTGNKTTVHMAKVRDMGGLLCNTDSELDDGVYESEDVAELLPGGSRMLAVRDLTVTPNNITPGHAFYKAFQQGKGFYTVEFKVSAGTTSELEASAESCRAPSDKESNINFCAIDVFKFSSRVGSSSER
jgi:hypothetical protein